MGLVILTLLIIFALLTSLAFQQRGIRRTDRACLVPSHGKFNLTRWLEYAPVVLQKRFLDFLQKAGTRERHATAEKNDLWVVVTTHVDTANAALKSIRTNKNNFRAAHHAPA